MNLVTVASQKYIPNTICLIESYNKQSFKQKVFLYTFNVEPETKDKILLNFKNVEILDIPNINSYIYNTQVFLFKSYSLYDAISKKINFIYSDSSNLFIKDAIKIVDFTINNERLLLKYPEEIKKNKYFTTSRCLKELGCDTEDIREKKQYWAGLQAYVYNEKNYLFLKECYEKMLIKNVAFPESKREKPEGIDKDCWFHRNDQSVLSALAEKNNLSQEFNYDIFNMCGDFPTVFNHDESYKKYFDYNKILIYPRYSNLHGLNMSDFLRKIFL